VSLNKLLNKGLSIKDSKMLSIKDVRSQGGLSSADILRTRGGINSSRFCADVFHARPLNCTLKLGVKLCWQTGITKESLVEVRLWRFN